MLPYNKVKTQLSLVARLWCTPVTGHDLAAQGPGLFQEEFMGMVDFSAIPFLSAD